MFIFHFDGHIHSKQTTRPRHAGAAVTQFQASAVRLGDWGRTLHGSLRSWERDKRNTPEKNTTGDPLCGSDMAPPVRQLSTAFSDLVLAFTAFGCAHLVKSVSPFTAGGFCAVGIAASFGVLKFGAAFPRRHASITKMHVLFTWLASTAGEMSFTSLSALF